jgi:hypothetical protein
MYTVWVSIVGEPVWRSTTASARPANSQSRAAIRSWSDPSGSPGQHRFMFALTESSDSGVVYET